jgi:hypothetical protein
VLEFLSAFLFLRRLGTEVFKKSPRFSVPPSTSRSFLLFSPELSHGLDPPFSTLISDLYPSIPPPPIPTFPNQTAMAEKVEMTPSDAAYLADALRSVTSPIIVSTTAHDPPPSQNPFFNMQS